MGNWIWFGVPVIVGLMQPVVWQMTLQLSKRVGEMPASVLLHFIGAVAGAVLVWGGLRGGNGDWSSMPWWAWLGGVIGVCCLWLLNMTVPKIGVAPFMAFLVASQLIGGLVFEKFGLMGAEVRSIHWHHLLGVACLTLGAYLVSRPGLDG